MKYFIVVLVGMGLLCSGCQEKEEDSDVIDKMVRIEEEAVEWKAPQDKHLAEEDGLSIQESLTDEE